jgi:hypothetical protein
VVGYSKMRQEIARCVGRGANIYPPRQTLQRDLGGLLPCVKPVAVNDGPEQGYEFISAAFSYPDRTWLEFLQSACGFGEPLLCSWRTSPNVSGALRVLWRSGASQFVTLVTGELESVIRQEP